MTLRTSTGKACPLITGISGSSFTVSLSAWVGHTTTHSPQKLHLAGSMSMRGLVCTRPSTNCAAEMVMASCGQTVTHSSQPQHLACCTASS